MIAVNVISHGTTVSCTVRRWTPRARYPEELYRGEGTADVTSGRALLRAALVDVIEWLDRIDTLPLAEQVSQRR